MTQCQTTAERALRWREAGIPEGYSISRLLYNQAAEALVIEIRGIKEETLRERLLFRHIRASRYESIGSPERDVAFRSPASCEKHPIVAFNAWRWEGGGADWDGLYIFDLQTKALNLCVSESNFVVPPPYDGRGWVSDLLSLSEDGSFAYVKAAFGKRGTEEGKETVRYEYHVGRLDLTTGDIRLISRLENIWF